MRVSVTEYTAPFSCVGAIYELSNIITVACIDAAGRPLAQRAVRLQKQLGC